MWRKCTIKFIIHCTNSSYDIRYRGNFQENLIKENIKEKIVYNNEILKYFPLNLRSRQGLLLPSSHNIVLAILNNEESQEKKIQVLSVRRKETKIVSFESVVIVYMKK